MRAPIARDRGRAAQVRGIKESKDEGEERAAEDLEAGRPRRRNERERGRG